MESPLRPGYQRDWVDHIRPSARGGTTDITNGVCASHTFNAKKRHNTADNCYLFKEGCPTWIFRDIFGTLTPEQDSRLRRLSRLRTSDWYLNRAIGQTFLGFDYRCGLKRYDKQPTRDDRYWFGSAYKKIVKFRSLDTGLTLEDRGIVKNPGKFAQSWLALRALDTEQEFLSIVESIYPFYRINFDAWVDYFYDEDCQTAAQRLRAVRRAEKTKGLTEDTLQCILADFALRNHKNG